MKNFSVLVAVSSVLFGVFIFASRAQAQFTRSDGGVIVVEDRILSPFQKQIVFVVAKNFPNESTLQFQTLTNEGIVHNYPEQHFPQGLTKGQIIPIWNGDFNIFETTAWLRFDVTITSGDSVYYTLYSTPIGEEEQYKEPMIVDISETRINPGEYSYTLTGNFDRYDQTTIIINSNLFVSSKSVTFQPGKMQFSVLSATSKNFPTGKFLLTVCQAGHCDTMIGRHR